MFGFTKKLITTLTLALGFLLLATAPASAETNVPGPIEHILDDDDDSGDDDSGDDEESEGPFLFIPDLFVPFEPAAGVTALPSLPDLSVLPSPTVEPTEPPVATLPEGIEVPGPVDNDILDDIRVNPDRPTIPTPVVPEPEPAPAPVLPIDPEILEPDFEVDIPRTPEIGDIVFDTPAPAPATTPEPEATPEPTPAPERSTAPAPAPTPAPERATTPAPAPASPAPAAATPATSTPEVSATEVAEQAETAARPAADSAETAAAATGNTVPSANATPSGVNPTATVFPTSATFDQAGESSDDRDKVAAEDLIEGDDITADTADDGTAKAEDSVQAEDPADTDNDDTVSSEDLAVESTPALDDSGLPFGKIVVTLAGLLVMVAIAGAIVLGNAARSRRAL